MLLTPRFSEVSLALLSSRTALAVLLDVRFDKPLKRLMVNPSRSTALKRGVNDIVAARHSSRSA
jgi:hypothetical protein